MLHSLARERQVIAVELQGHGHTPDINRPETFEQDADYVALFVVIRSDLTVARN